MTENQSIREAYIECLNTQQAEESIDEIIVEISEDLIQSGLYNFSESRWVDSHKPGWRYRLDPMNTNTKTLRHVHIAKTKHTSSPRMQAAWNDDGTRHDKRNFNPSVGNKKAAQQIARTALNLPIDAVMECFSLNTNTLLGECNNPEGSIFCFSTI